MNHYESDRPSIGNGCVIGNHVSFGKNVVVKHNCIIEDGASLGDNTYIDSNCIIHGNVSLGDNSNVGSNCILGEYLMDFYQDHMPHNHPLKIGNNALIRSGSIIYGDCRIGESFQTGHQVTIREKSDIGNHVSIGTLSDIQGNCSIGDYTRLHSNVHVGQLSRIGSYVWIFPYVVLTNDPTPPSENFVGVCVDDFAVIATGSILLPGVKIAGDSLIAAGAIVTKDVAQGTVVGGNPAKVISSTDRIKNHITGEKVYPWRYSFDRGMPWEGIGYDEWNRQSGNYKRESGGQEQLDDEK